MDRIECMKSFARTVETGSFSAVAREMETTQPPTNQLLYRFLQLIAGEGLHSAKVRCFVDFLASEFKLNPWVSDYGIS